MTLTYLKKIFPMTWKRTYTPPVPPTQYYEITFDTSSQYITNTVTPFTVEDWDDAIYYSATPNTVSVWWTNVTMQLADEWTSITWWSMESDWVTQTLPAWTHALIIDDTEFIPTVSHIIIHRDTQWPCPNGFHIGTQTEWNTVVSALDTLWVKNETDTKNYLKIPDAYYLNRTNWSKNTSYWTVRIWTSTMSNNTTAPAFIIDEKNVVQVKDDKPGNAFSIRPFKDSPVTPDSSWTTLYQWTWNAWIFWNSTLWLISISWNWTTWTTMTDKNLWATNVWDDWLYYQFWNNRWFTVSPSDYYTSKISNTQAYWPGNYYNDKFTRVSSWNGWFTDTNNNIWWWVTNGTWTE